MFDSKMLSKSIRMQKKKMMNAEPKLVDTDSKPDMNPMDLYDVDKHAQVEETVNSPKKINADETAMDEPYEQEAMSHEPMKSAQMPKDHHKMAYGGAVEHGDPMMPSEMDEEMIAGSRGTASEMSQRIGDSFPSGSKGKGIDWEPESEEMRRTKMRKMRLASYMDGLDI